MARVFATVLAVSVVIVAVLAIPYPQEGGDTTPAPAPGNNFNNQPLPQNCQGYLEACKNQSTQIQSQQTNNPIQGSNPINNTQIQQIQNNNQNLQPSNFDTCNQQQMTYCQQMTNNTQFNQYYPQGVPQVPINNTYFPNGNTGLIRSLFGP